MVEVKHILIMTADAGFGQRNDFDIALTEEG